MTAEEMATEITKLEVERAKFVADNAQDLAPFGTRSTNVKLREAELIVKFYEDLTQSGTKTNETQREAMLTLIKTQDEKYAANVATQNEKMFALASLDAKISGMIRSFAASYFNNVVDPRVMEVS